MSNNSSLYEEEDVCSKALLCSPVIVIATCVSLIGILANSGVLGIIFRVKRLHRPIFFGFAALALADLLYLVFNTFLVHLGWFIPSGTESDIVAIILSIMAITSALSSASHVTFLSIQQYFMIAHPLSSLARQTNKTVFRVSLSIWILCTIPASFYIYAVKISKNPSLRKTVNFCITIIVTFVPILVILVCHFLKLRALKESITNDRQATRKKMSKIVSAVVLSYLVTTLPINIHDTIKLAREIEISMLYIVIYRIAFTLLHLNFTINPFIYFIFTPNCRRVLLFVNCFKCKKYKTAEISSRHTRSTLLSQEPCVGVHETSGERYAEVHDTSHSCAEVRETSCEPMHKQDNCEERCETKV
ncbi:kappa-type opioid receptor-like [Saccostrea echinata]|uniref:kappa-type opioid receptor-like n=1 Tax=Saccostrea echinata TaxID=191078 RepID=UPI002A83C10B|nr:kappa-type opioid receptor-like [Saccostrea echinata]